MWCLCLASYPPSPPLTLYVVCCVVHMLLQNSVYAGGAYLYACVKCVGCYECVFVMHPPTHCDDLVFFVLPILPLQARTICVLGYNHSRLEHLG